MHFSYITTSPSDKKKKNIEICNTTPCAEFMPSICCICDKTTCGKVTLVNMADKENNDPDTPVAKKRRPILLLSKKGKAVLGEDCFKFDRSNSVRFLS